jgi:Cytochrome c oxidase assembly protein CtaG/Cox11
MMTPQLVFLRDGRPGLLSTPQLLLSRQCTVHGLQEQKLRPGEKIDMPVFFYVDPEFATDPRMKRVNHLTLSYTFFKVTCVAYAHGEQLCCVTAIGFPTG